MILPETSLPQRFFFVFSFSFALFFLCAVSASAIDKKESLPSADEASPSAASTWQSSIVYPGGDGKLVYISDAEGNRIPDFSHAGYHGGGVPLPSLPVRITLNPSVSGDDTQQIQDALDAVGAMAKDENGHRGAVKLNAGNYRITSQIQINHSGVVLRGAGDGANPASNTIINVAKSIETLAMRVGKGNAWNMQAGSPRTDIVTDFVVVGSRHFEVADASGFSPGDDIIIYHPVTDEWAKAVEYGGPPPDASNPWSSNDANLNIIKKRQITGISGNVIAIDAPVYNHLNRQLSVSEIYKPNLQNTITESGVEHLRIAIESDGPTETTHTRDALLFNGVEHCWAQHVTVINYALYGISTTNASFVTIQNSSSLEPHSPIHGGWRYNYNAHIRSSNILFENNLATEGRHCFTSNGTASVSGIVFTNSTSIGNHAASEGHRRWSQGLLFDKITFEDSNVGAVLGEFLISDMVLALYNRGDWGTRHGWSAAHSVAWNVDASGKNIVIQQPPTAQNYAIGNRGTVSGNGPWTGPVGFIEGTGQTPALLSLYEAQLDERLQHGVPPDAPNLLTARFSFNDGSIRLEWNHLDLSEVTLVLQRSVNGGSFTTLATFPSSTTFYLDDTVSENNEYSYRIAAQKGGRLSAWSNEAAMYSSTEIYTWSDLNAIRNNPGLNYVLKNNLDEFSPGYTGLGDDWTPIGTDTDPFTGIFDGNGYTITGLTISGHSNTGLFGEAHDATIMHTALHNLTLSATGTNVGGLVGRASNSVIYKSHTTGSITSSGTWNVGGLAGLAENNTSIIASWSGADVNHTNASGGGRVGGITGTLLGGSEIERSFASGNVSGRLRVGGLVGQMANFDGTGPGFITDSYARGNVDGMDNTFGGLVGVNYSAGSEINRTYSTGQVKASAISGGLIGQNGGGAVLNSFWDTQTSGQASSEGGTGKTTAALQDRITYLQEGWEDFDEEWVICSGYSYPYLIATFKPIGTWSELNAIRNNPGLNYILKNHLNESSPGYAGTGDSWTPIGTSSSPFAGIFYGNGLTITGLTINGHSNLGFFGETNGASIIKMALQDLTLSATGMNIGGLVGRANNSFIYKSHTAGSITSSGSWNVGGLVGLAESDLSIIASWSDAVVNHTNASGGGRVGGIAGTLLNGSEIKRSFASGNVSGRLRVGGLVGQMANFDGTGPGFITDSYARGNVDGMDNTFGGLVGVNYSAGSEINRTYSTGQVKASAISGGLIGQNGGGAVLNSFWDTQTSGTTSSDGGTGRTTAQMKTTATFTAAGWDFSDVWDMEGSINNGYPFLRTESAPDPDPDPDPNRITEIPYTEDFSGVAVPALPAGWESLDNVVTNDGWTEFGTTITLEFPPNFSVGPMAILPEIDAEIDITTLEFSFDIYVAGDLGGAENMKVGFISDPGDAGTFTLIEEFSATNDIAEHTVSLAGYNPGDGRRIALYPESFAWNRFIVQNVSLDEDGEAPDPDPDPDPNRIAEIPYMENFSDVTVPALPDGWGNIGDVVTFDGWTAIGGTTLEFPLGIASDDYRIAVFPKIDASIDISTLKLKFNVQTPSIVDDERIEVGFLTNPADPAAFTLIESVSLLPDAAVLDAEVGLAGYQESDGRYLALKAESPSDWNRFFIGYVELEEGTPVVSSETATEVPAHLSLSQNYPNPFNPVTMIDYALPENSEVRLEVFDMLGRRVTVLAKGKMKAGSHTAIFDASGFSSGVYIYRLSVTGGESLTRRMTIVK